MSSTIKKVSFIGSGNVATHLATKLYAEGIQIVDIYSRKLKKAKLLASKINANPTNQLDSLSTGTQLAIIAVKDDAISSVVTSLPQSIKRNILIAHTSGSVSSAVLSASVKKHGIFYPLQSFSINKQMDYKSIPFCIRASSKKQTNKLIQLAKLISNNVNEIDDDQRAALHLAAVFANNFSNHMYTLAKTICEASHVDYRLLKPLLNEGFEKMMLMGPESAQTGPALRNDLQTIEKHLKRLQKTPSLKNIYTQISDHITHTHN